MLERLQERNDFLTGIDRTRSQRCIVSLDGRPKLMMEASDLQRVESSTGRLTGCGLNALAAALLNFFSHPTSPDAGSANKCAVLSTYDLVRIRYKASDDVLWKKVHPTKFWDKQLWLIPIHHVDEEHWVLVVVDVSSQQVLFFDSLGGKGRWRQDIRVCVLFHKCS